MSRRAFAPSDWPTLKVKAVITSPVLEDGGKLQPAHLPAGRRFPGQRAKVPPIKEAKTEELKLPAKATEADLMKLLEEAGPPVEWSGAIAAMLGSDRRKALETLWESLGKEEQERVMLAWQVGFDETEKALWGSPAGKKYLARTLAGLLPDHKTYVEPFAGSAAVLFSKEPAEREVLNDLDKDIAFSFRFVKALNEDKLERLRKFDWRSTKENRERVRKLQPKDDVERFYRLRLLAWSSFYSDPAAGPNPLREGQTYKLVKRLERGRERLKDVIVRNADYGEVVKEFDGPDTAFYLDPPYLGFQQNVGEREFDGERFAKILRSIKGKFVATWEGNVAEARKLFKGLQLRLVTVGHHAPRGGTVNKETILITNYDLPRRILKQLPGLILSPVELAEAVRDGKKKLIVKSRPFDIGDGSFVLLSGRRAYAVIRLGKMEELSLDDFEARRPEHLIGDDLRRHWWPEATTLYAWPVKVLSKFEEPVETNVPTGPQVTVRRVEVEGAEVAKDGGVMLGLWLPKELAREMAVGSGAKDDDLHLTLAYLGKRSELGESVIDELRAIASDFAINAEPMSGVIGGVGRFAASQTSDSKDVLYASVDVPALAEFRQKLVDDIRNKCSCGDIIKRDHGFTPHVTLAYIEPGAPLPIDKMDRHPVRLHELVLAVGDERHVYPFGKRVTKAEEPRGKLPALKMPDPAFNIARLKARQPTGVLSRLRREARAGNQQFLINETGPTDQPAQVWGVVTIDESEGPYAQLAELPERLRGGLDQFTLREFSTVKDLFYLPMRLVVAYDPPIPLKSPPPGRRFAAEVELPEDVKKTRTDYGEAYYSGQSEPDIGFVQEFGEVSRYLVGKKLLDIGAGTGRALKVLKASGYEPEGADISEWAVGRMLDSGLRATQADATRLPFPDGTFDSAFSLHTLEHVRDLDTAIRESIRVARSRAAHLVPLGMRLDPTHRHVWMTLQDFKDAVYKVEGLDGVGMHFHRIIDSPSGMGGDVAILVLDKTLRSPYPVLQHVQAFTVIPDFVSLVGSAARAADPNDIDILIRHDGPFAGMELRLRNLLPKVSGLRDKLHFVYNEPGPHDDHVPLYDLIAVPKSDFHVRKIEKQKGLRPLQRFTPLKTGVGYTQQEFFVPEQLWEGWAKGFIVDDKTPIDVEQKFNGFRTVMQRDGGGDTLIYFEDSKTDRSPQFPGLVQELRAIKSEGGVILDADLGATYKNGRSVPRKFLGTLISANQKVPEDGLFKLPTGDVAQLRVRVFDVLFLDGEDLHTKPWTDRRKALETAFGRTDFKLMEMSPKNIVTSEDEFKRVVTKVSKLDGSEGAVAKVVNSDYPLTGQTLAWAKTKTALEIKVEVIDRTPVKGARDQWNYVVGYTDQKGKLRELGKTFNTKIDAKPGDVLTLEVEEVIPEFDKEADTWTITAVVPKVADLETGTAKAEPVMSIVRRAHEANVLQAEPAILDMLRLGKSLHAAGFEIMKAREGNLDFKEGESGTGVVQTHERGLFEQQTKLTDSFGWDPVELSEAQLSRLSELAGKDLRGAYRSAQEGDSSPLSSALDKIIGGREGRGSEEFEALSATDQKLVALASPVSIHTDFRFRRGKDPYWEGGEGFTPGNQFKSNKARDIQAGEEAGKVLMNFKVPRVGEATESEEDIIRGPIVWLTIGRGQPKSFPPGAVGSTANAWSRFHVREPFHWIAGVQDEHFKEFWIEGQPISGRWLMQFAPVGPGAAQAEGRAWMLSRPKEQEPKSEVLRERLAKGIDVRKSLWCPIVKADDERRLITGIVLQPDTVDAQGDIIDAETIEAAAHKFLRDYNTVTRLGHQHKEFPGGLYLVESWVAPAEIKLADKPIRKGTWLITTHVTNGDIWSKVKAGAIRGFSIGGVAKVQRLRY